MKTSLKNLTDEQLMALVADNSDDAFNILMKRYDRLSKCYARKIVHDHHRAQDIVCVAFSRIWNHRHRFNQHRGTFGAWIMRIIRNLAYNANRDYRRRDAACVSFEELLELEECPCATLMTASAEIVALSRITKSRVLHYLKQVPEPYKETLTMWISNPNTEEIAARLNIAKGTIRSRVSRAREFLYQQPEIREIIAA